MAALLALVLDRLRDNGACLSRFSIRRRLFLHGLF
jgi:hypothetical protein